jgi:branched-chain amino acid transport system substrate-binding protein
MLVQEIGKKEGGLDKLKGKKIALVYHDSPYGKEPIALLEKRAKMSGFELMLLPVTHPGVEQKATWLQVRQNRPDYVLLWGWGVMNSTAIKEAVAVGYPRDKMYGVWWSGGEPDVRPADDGAKGYHAVTLQHTAGRIKIHEDLKKYLYDKGKGLAKWDDTGDVLYVRGLINGMLGIEAIRTAQAHFGNKPMNGEQTRWGLEHLNVTAERIKQLGFEGELKPIKVSCADHEGARTGRIQTWDGKNWKITSDWYTSDDEVIEPLVKETSAKYAADKKLSVGCLSN